MILLLPLTQPKYRPCLGDRLAMGSLLLCCAEGDGLFRGCAGDHSVDMTVQWDGLHVG